MTPPITQKHLYGWKMEQILRPHLEEYLEDFLVPTEFRFDGCDLKSETSDNEIKARPKYSVKYKTLQTPDTYPEWLLPTCKVDKFDTKSGRELNFFYYWGATQECFHLQYTKEKFDSYRRAVPFFSRQEHFYIPKEDWKLILAEVPDELPVE